MYEITHNGKSELLNYEQFKTFKKDLMSRSENFTVKHPDGFRRIYEYTGETNPKCKV